MRAKWIVLLFLIPAFAQSDEARRLLSLGVQAYKDARYAEAVQHFQSAIQAEPDFLDAWLHLGTAYTSQYVPGADTPANVEFARQAEEAFRQVLEREPENRVALASLGSLCFNQKKFDDAAEWNRRLIRIEPRNKEAFYTLGVIAWTKSYDGRKEARARAGMKLEDRGPIKDPALRQELRERNLAVIDEGVRNMETALGIDPDYDDAMVYINLLYREKADLQDSTEEYARYTRMADEWVRKTLATKKVKAARRPNQQ
jgi:tetratricopeptide (TPR) repeat protein